MIQTTVFISYRSNAGLSQKELADLAGVSQQLIGEIEMGRTKSTKAIYRIAAALETSPHTLDPDIPDWDERFSAILSDMRKLSDTENRVVLAKMEKVIRDAMKRSAKVTPRKRIGTTVSS